ncbi:uncharacterized protein K02A2.6-like [Haliotis rubra]|uniref:uncharacterized protein K02A2.6-like n=1 Tax=Haliotis rubra TaxID=36100 RepID=UPI001EE548C1|nr:uncharacterized protein K02A2.6-like [Haliotis rubra]
MCQSRGYVQVIDEEEEEEKTDEVFLGAFGSNTPKVKDYHYAEVMVDGVKVSLKADTGADVTVISKVCFDTNFPRRHLTPPDRVLKGLQNKLTMDGYFKATLKWKQKSLVEKVYVLTDTSHLLLSCKASEYLGILAFCGTLTMDGVTKEFPELFTGLGKLAQEYEIKVQPDAHPYAVTFPRRVPIPIQLQVKTQLDKLEGMGVIWKVEEPTDWCAPMIVVPKSNGDVRIRVDLRQLNLSVSRERHMFPTVDHTLGQLANAKVFTKIDANSGFHQIKLTENSALLTTFITPFGRYCYTRLPFGITSAPEYFQKQVSSLLDGQEALREAGFTLNKNKCEFGKSQVQFLGQTVSDKGIQLSMDKVAAVKDMQEPKNFADVRRFLEHKEGWRPVVYASHSLSDTETRYAHIEKEALALTWACERFQDYLVGIQVVLETDHKPLIPLLGMKDLDHLPPAPMDSPKASDMALEQDAEVYINQVAAAFPASDKKLEEIKLYQQEDEVCREITRYCTQENNNPPEPLIASELPDRPWERVASDLFEIRRSHYVLVVDYFSRFIEISKLSSTTSKDVINSLKSIFARHGIPQVMISDNGPQYASEEFARFSREYGFSHDLVETQQKTEALTNINIEGKLTTSVEETACVLQASPHCDTGQLLLLPCLHAACKPCIDQHNQKDIVCSCGRDINLEKEHTAVDFVRGNEIAFATDDKSNFITCCSIG